MASRFDPLGLVDLAAQTVRTTAATTASVASWSERQVLGILRSRLDATTASTEASQAPTAAAPAEGLHAKLRRLLDRPVEEGTTSSRQELFHKILDQIVPDEARILGALADGSSSPLLHVYEPTTAGPIAEVVLENMSLIGKTANLALPHLTPTYVSHLLSLGLVETGPEDPGMQAEYDVLAADAVVLRAVKRASHGRLPARIEKYTLRLSGLGIDLWSAASQRRSES